MANRFMVDVPTNYSPDQVNDIIAQFMKAEGFNHSMYRGEPILKKGLGFLTAPQFIKLDVQPGFLHIEAFLKYAILPGVFVGEMGLDGFAGAIPKQMLKGRVDKLIAAVRGQ